MRYYDVTKETAFEYLKRTISEHKTDECLEWPFHREPRHGYGKLVVPFKRNVQSAHRVAYYLAYGEWPMPLGRHTCNNPPCYNPFHIEPGSDADNSADRVAAGHNCGPKGEANAAAKLTEQNVVQIRERYATSSTRKLAAQYGVDRMTILRIVSGQDWKHVGGPIYQQRHKPPKGEAHRDAILNDAQVIEIRISRMSVMKLAKLYGVHYTTISHIKAGRKWKHLAHTPVYIPYNMKRKKKEAPEDASNQLLLLDNQHDTP